MTSTPRLSTFADFVRLHYGLAAECPRGGRSVRVNLAAIIFAGRGDQHVHKTRPRCRSCGTVGTYRILRPDPPPTRATPHTPGPPDFRGGIWATSSKPDEEPK